MAECLLACLLLHLDLLESQRSMIVTAAVSPAPVFCLSPFADLGQGWCIIHKLHFLIVHRVVILLPT